jgi:hypothetical protein
MWLPYLRVFVDLERLSREISLGEETFDAVD